DSRVRDQAVESTEGLERTRHEASGTVPVRDVLGVRDRFAPEPANLLDDGVGRRGRGSGSVDLASAIVHDHPGAVSRQRERVAATEAPARAGDDDDAPVEQVAHWSTIRVPVAVRLLVHPW